MDILGWIGSVLLAFCALPQAIESWRTGSSQGVAWGLLIMWGLGELFMILHVWPLGDVPLLLNYSANIILVGIIAFYKIFPRR
jgi:uncharacterized protein with PQ loop repeat